MADSTNIAPTDLTATQASAPVATIPSVATGDQVAVTDKVAAAQPAPKRNPLDILEEILDNAEAQTEINKANEEQERLAAERAAKEELIRQQDLARIEEERAKMADIGSSPQEQARQAQQQQKMSEVQQHQDQQQGYEIVQLGHTKI